MATKVFSKINIIPDFVNGHFIQWELDPMFRGARPYNFALQISQTPTFSELIAVKDNLGDVFFAIDDTNLKQAWSSNYHYRIVLTTADNTKYHSNAVLFGASRLREQRHYAMAAEVIRKEILACRYAGGPCWLLKRKSYGTKSAVVHKNVDPVSGVPITDQKFEDYGVGLDGGYFDAVPCSFYADNTSQDKQLDPNGIGVKETFDIIARMPGYPIVDVRDVICDANDGYRYSVMSKAAKNFPGTGICVVQKVSLRLIPQSDTIYSIPIPVTL